LRQCLSYHEGNFQFVIRLDVVAFHVTGYVVHRVYRQSEILEFCWLHVGSHYYSYRNVRQAALTIENDTKRLREVCFLLAGMQLRSLLG